MIIHGPHENQPYDIDLGPVFLSDYYHSPYLEIVANVVGKDVRATWINDMALC